MPGRGRPPSKAEWSRERDQRRREAEFTRVTDDGQLRGPDLPDSITWHDRTLAWWDNWRRSPLSQTFTTTDWDFLLDTAVLHNDLWAGNTGVAAELRLRVAKFGASPEDRLRLKVEVTDEVAAAKAEPRVDSDRKARLVAVANA
jgi:hypothetical protein